MTTCAPRWARPTCCAATPTSRRSSTSTLDAVLAVEARVTRRSGGLLHGALAAVGVVGVALVLSGDLSTARLVTLFLVTTMFVGRRRHARPPPARPPGGLRRGAAAARHDGLARRAHGRPPRARRPARRGVPAPRVHATAPAPSPCATSTSCVTAGHTCALVGRTGSGKSTLASLLSRAVEPPRGTVFLGGVDVLDLDLQQLRAAVGVVTQRTEVLAGTLADNITLFDDVPAHGRRGGGRRARPDRLGRRAARRASTPSSAPAAPACPPARSSSSPSPGCWCATSASSSSTRPRPGWTRSPRPASCAPPTG